MSATYVEGCPVCGMTWNYQVGGQHVACLRDRHIVEQHPMHAFALVVVANRAITERHPLDEPCLSVPDEVTVAGPDAETPDVGPFELLDDTEDYLDAAEETLLDLAAEAVERFDLSGGSSDADDGEDGGL